MESQPPSCLVTDYRMPGISGLDLLRRLRCADSRLPVVLITGVANAQLPTLVTGLERVAVLEKPLFGRSLVETIHRLVATS